MLPPSKKLTLPLGVAVPLLATVAVNVTEVPYCDGFTLEASAVVVGAVKTMSRIGWSSMPFGATPVCPWMKSKKPTPVMRTGTFALWKNDVGLKRASNLPRAMLMPAVKGLGAGRRGVPEVTMQAGGGVSGTVGLACSSLTTMWELTVRFLLVQRERAVDGVDRAFPREDAGVVRRARRVDGRGEGAELRDGRGDGVVDVDLRGVGIDADLHGPALDAARGADDGERDRRGGGAALAVGERRHHRLRPGGAETVDRGLEREDVVAGDLVAVRAVVVELLRRRVADARQVGDDAEARARRERGRRHRHGEQRVAGRLERVRRGQAAAGGLAGVAAAAVRRRGAVARNRAGDEEVVEVVVGVDAAVVAADGRVGVAERGRGRGFEAVRTAVADEVDEAARARAAERGGAGDEGHLRVRRAHGDDAGGVGRRERRGAAAALRLLHEVVVARLNRSGEERRRAVRGPRRRGGRGGLHAPAVERDRRG